jgi:uncharacterized phage protein (TIGR01671 family)
MSRTIKFRGLRKDKPTEWVYGDLCTQDAEHDAQIGVWHYDGTGIKWVPVLPESVGQFTGIPDKNDKIIWEGDTVKRRVNLVEGSDYMDYNCTVKWNGWCYALFVHDKQLWGLNPSTAKECEIIGPIRTTPELIEK